MTCDATNTNTSRTGMILRTWVVLLKFACRPVLNRAARQILQGRLLDPDEPEQGRWLRTDVSSVLQATWVRVDEILPEAGLDDIPTYGNRLNVFLAVVTTSAYQVLLEQGVGRERAATLVSDIGWKVYASMVSLAAAPFRIATRSSQKRMQLTLRALMRFPFSAPGRPGYEVETWTVDELFFTHWTHCPPQSFVRRLVETHGDRGELDAFYRSWCLYDWPGADLLVGDAAHGHYTRPHTMSRGDDVCDMCWSGRAIPVDAPGECRETTVAG